RRLAKATHGRYGRKHPDAAGLKKVPRMSPPRVLVLYNQPVLPAHHPDAASEHEIVYTVEAIERALTAAGYIVGLLGVSHDPSVLLHGVQRFQPDVVFNLFEGTGDDSNNEAYAAGLLEWLRIPFTGCPSQTLGIAKCKPLTKHL